jgi:hypothetical protein
MIESDKGSLRASLTHINKCAVELCSNSNFKIGPDGYLVGCSSWWDRVIFWVRDFFTWGGATRKVHEVALETLKTMKGEMKRNIPCFQFFCEHCKSDKGVNELHNYGELLEKIKKYPLFEKNEAIQNFEFLSLPESPEVEAVNGNKDLYKIKSESDVKPDYEKIVNFTKNLKLTEPLSNEDKKLINYYVFKKVRVVTLENDSCGVNNVTEFVNRTIERYEDALKEIENKIQKNVIFYFRKRGTWHFTEKGMISKAPYYIEDIFNNKGMAKLFDGDCEIKLTKQYTLKQF